MITKNKRIKRGLKMVLIIIAVLVLLEAIALAWMIWSAGSYKKFWAAKANAPGDITYLALGDSAAQGIGASSPSKGYVGLIAARIEQKTGKKVRVINLSKTGAKLSDYLNEQAPKVKTIKADVVTIDIGANDIGKFDPVAFRSEFKKVLATLPKGTFVANMPLFNSRPMSTANAKAASEIIHQELANFPNLAPVDLQAQTTAHQSIFGFAPDLFHPNNLSYENWADAFWKEISTDFKD